MAAAVGASQRIWSPVSSSQCTGCCNSQARSGAAARTSSVAWRRRDSSTTAGTGAPLRLFPRRALAHPAHQRLDLRCSALSSVSGSQSFSSAEQVLRFLAPRPPAGQEASARALVIRAGLLEVIKGFLSTLWNLVIKAPVLTFAKIFQREVDDATDIVKEGAQVVLRIAHTVDDLADKVEAYAENVAEIAEKVIETTDKVDDQLEDVVEVLSNADDVDDIAAGISEQAGISVATLASLKAKSQAVQAKGEELKAVSTELKEASRAVLEEKKDS